MSTEQSMVFATKLLNTGLYYKKEGGGFVKDKSFSKIIVNC
jgi:hypothetical protein